MDATSFNKDDAALEAMVSSAVSQVWTDASDQFWDVFLESA